MLQLHFVINESQNKTVIAGIVSGQHDDLNVATLDVQYSTHSSAFGLGEYCTSRVAKSLIDRTNCIL